MLATFFFAIQLYCDFSGYTDIALGSARLLGINLTQNFKAPYFASSIKDFWGRWHISLSSWLKDYIYIPLGGNRVGKVRHALNIMITFLVSRPVARRQLELYIMGRNSWLLSGNRRIFPLERKNKSLPEK